MTTKVERRKIMDTLPEVNNLHAWIKKRKITDHKMAYADKVMITDARHGLRGAPSKCFVERFDMVFGEAETNRAIPNAPAIRASDCDSLSQRKIEKVREAIKKYGR
jgi:hypothetical protein